MSGTILDRGKTDFKDPATVDAEMKQAQRQAQADTLKKKDPEQDGIDKINAAMSGDNAEAEKNEADLRSLAAYSEEDLALAEELLFRGYAEKTYKVLKNATITVTSMSAAEVELVNEMVYEFANKPAPAPDKDTKPDPFAPTPGISAKVVESYQQALIIALGFKGVNGSDISPAATRTLAFIKSGFKRMSEQEIEGDVANYTITRAELKKVVGRRAAEMKRVQVSLIDVISKRRFEFERMMHDIMSRDDLLPKS